MIAPGTPATNSARVVDASGQLDTPATTMNKAVRAPTHPHSHSHGLLASLQSLLTMLAVALFILTFTVQPFRIPSGSMEPTLLIGDFLLVEKQAGAEGWPHIFAPLGVVRRGDIVIFHFPVDATMHLVKRVVGLPGDRIRLHEGRVYVNGQTLDEPYAIYTPAPEDSYRDEFPHLDRADPGVSAHWWVEMRSRVANGELTVPADSYFVLGDNRNDSEDSRYWGFVPSENIVGKPVLIYFSLNNGEAETPGQPEASAMPGEGATKHQGTAQSLLSFARWERTFRVVR
ncbi:MAG TPA: signal peptidase I [Acidobacteriaceae bacterium]